MPSNILFKSTYENEIFLLVACPGWNDKIIVLKTKTPSEAKPGSLWTCGQAPSPTATPRVCHRPPDCTRGSPHFSAYPGTLWC